MGQVHLDQRPDIHGSLRPTWGTPVNGVSKAENIRIDNNNFGHPVYQILTDYQANTVGPDGGISSAPGGAGWMRFMQFDMTTDTIHFSTYSSLLDKYAGLNGEYTFNQVPSFSDFSLPIPAQAIPEPSSLILLALGGMLFGLRKAGAAAVPAKSPPFTFVPSLLFFHLTKNLKLRRRIMSSLLRFRFAAIAALAAVAASLASVGYVSADVVLPTGLPAGSQYRLVFITADSRDATSTDIADYNAFVTQEAQQSSSPFVRSLTWSAIASTQAVKAFDNANLGAAVAVYNTNGQMVVPGTQPSPLLSIVHSSPIIYDQNGTGNFDPLLSTWTGSTYAGEPTFVGYPQYHYGLGTSTPIYGAAASLAIGGLNVYSEAG